jgi:hypothetical protein
MPLVYPASKSYPRYMEMWRALRAAGIPLVADWIDSELNETDAKPTADQWARLWLRNIEQASAADIVLFYADEGQTQCGSLIEIGCALSHGRQVYLVSDYEWTIQHHRIAPPSTALRDASAG